MSPTKSIIFRQRPRGMIVGIFVVALAVSWLAACEDDAAAPIVGSNMERERAIDAMFVEAVSISLPFKAVVYNGTERQLLIRGEDNLIAKIDVVETKMSHWEIRAPLNLMFEQHSTIEIEIPFLDMVSITLEGPVKLGDDPKVIWADEDAGM